MIESTFSIPPTWAVVKSEDDNDLCIFKRAAVFEGVDGSLDLGLPPPGMVFVVVVPGKASVASAAMRAASPP